MTGPAKNKNARLSSSLSFLLMQKAAQAKAEAERRAEVGAGVFSWRVKEKTHLTPTRLAHIPPPNLAP